MASCRHTSRHVIVLLFGLLATFASARLQLNWYPGEVSSIDGHEPDETKFVPVWDYDEGSDLTKSININETATTVSFYLTYDEALPDLHETSYKVTLRDPTPPADMCESERICDIVFGSSGTIKPLTRRRLGLICSFSDCDTEFFRTFDLDFKIASKHFTISLNKTFAANTEPVALLTLNNTAVPKSSADLIRRGVLVPRYDVVSGWRERRIPSPGLSGADHFMAHLEPTEKATANLTIEAIFADDRLGQIPVRPLQSYTLSSDSATRIAVGACEGFEALAKAASRKDGAFVNTYTIDDAVISVMFRLENDAGKSKGFRATYVKSCEVTYYNLNKAAIIVVVVSIVVISVLFISYCIWLAAKGSERAAKHRRACRNSCPRCCLCCVRYMRLQRAGDVQYTRPFEDDSDREDADVIADSENRRHSHNKRSDVLSPLSELHVAPEYFTTKQFVALEHNTMQHTTTGSIHSFRNDLGIDETGIDDRGMKSSMPLQKFSQGRSSQASDEDRKQVEVAHGPPLTPEQKAARKAKVAAQLAKRKEAEQRAALAVLGGEAGAAHAASLGIRPKILSSSRPPKPNRGNPRESLLSDRE